MADTQSVTPTRATVLDTPQEILDTICDLMITRDVGVLRGTCKELQAKIETVFKDMAFTTIEVHLNSRDLEFLQEVSKSRFAACVKVVHIRSRIKPERTSSEGEENKLATSRGDKKDIKWLAGVLSRFPDLGRLEVEATNTAASQTDPTDESQRRATRAHLGPGPGNTPPHKVISLAFQLALLAMAAMNRQGKKILELRAGAKPVGILRTSVDHTSLKPVDTSTLKGLANLSALQLVLEVQEGTTGSQREVYLANFLHCAPNLTRLSLSFWNIAGDWLSKTFTDVKLPHLSTLQVEAAGSVDALELEGFLKRHSSSLRCLELKSITFRNDVVVDVLSSIFISGELVLHSIKLQQLCNSKAGLLLFGADADPGEICHDCDKDRNATWSSEIGPGCKHASLVAEGEALVKEQLERVKEMRVLPFVPIV